MMRENHRWTNEEREFVRVNYKGTRASKREIARQLSEITGDTITEFGVGGQVSSMGLGKRSDYWKAWTKEDDEELRHLTGRYAPRTIAKMMHRSINSVVVRMKRKKLKRRAHKDWFTKKDVCQILGMDHKWLQRRIDSGELKASFYSPEVGRPTQKGGSFWQIRKDDLAVYIRKHAEELNGRNVDLVALVKILSLPCPPHHWDISQRSLNGRYIGKCIKCGLSNNWPVEPKERR